MSVVALIQARMMSSRLRGKSLMAVNGKPLLARVIDRVRSMDFIDECVVATTLDGADDPIHALAERLGVRCIRGDREDVLARFVTASENLADSDVAVRFTADNPLYDPRRSAAAWESHRAGDFDYTHVDGLSHMVPEFITVGALRRVAEAAHEGPDREHVTLHIRLHPEGFRINTLPSDFAGLRPDLDHMMTIDRHDQLELLERMLEDLEVGGDPAELDDCYLWLDRVRQGLTGARPARPGDTRILLAGHEVGDGCPCFVVAEIGQNHNGQMNLAKRLIDMAARCGADAVKFQKRDIDWELTEEAANRLYDNPNSFGRTYAEHRRFLELSPEQHLELREYAKASGLVYFCTPCDPPSVEQMDAIGCPFFKIASRDITNIPLLRVVARTGKPVILSTGMAGMQEIREALEALGNGPSGIIVLQCVSQYPAEPEHINLRAMETIRKEFGVLVGLSDHTPGIITAVAGSALGACVVEKHVTVSRAMPGTDHAGALEEEGLRRLVEYVRICARAMGDGRKEFDPVAEKAKAKLARSLTSRVAIPQGTVLTEDMLVLKSPGSGLLWRDRSTVVGRRALRDIPANVTLAEGDFGAA